MNVASSLFTFGSEKQIMLNRMLTCMLKQKINILVMAFYNLF